MQATYVYFLILLLEYQRDKHWTQWEEAAPIGQGGMVSMIFTAPDTCDAIGWTTPNAQHKCGLPPVGFQSF